MGACVAIRKTPEYVAGGSEDVNRPGSSGVRKAIGAEGEQLNGPSTPSRKMNQTHVEFIVEEVGGLPRKNYAMDKLSSKSGYFLEVWYENGGSKSMIYRTATRATQVNAKSTYIRFNSEAASVGETVVKVPMTKSTDDTKTPPFIRLQVFASYLESSISTGLSRLLGETLFPVSELEDKQHWKLWMFHPTTECLVYDRAHNDSPLFVSVTVPNGTPQPTPQPPAKRCVVITRGTRGDVQPFVALARGLAQRLNWSVTIVTEMRYRDLVVKHSNVLQGSIHFRPSGGDTESRIDRPLAKWFIMQDSAAFQLLMLARAEREFFESEPAFSYFTQEARPDYMLFGFNTANIALILSESFKLPICGFILQPTIIPSKQYPAIVAVGSADEGEKTATTSLLAEMTRGRRMSWSSLVGALGSPNPSEDPNTKPKSDSLIGEDAFPMTADEAPQAELTTPVKHERRASGLDDATIGDGSPSPPEEDPSSQWGLHSDLPIGNNSLATSANLDRSHTVIQMLKPLLENNIFSTRINMMRQAHKLGPQKGEDLDFKILQNLNVPMICPINPVSFGGHPDDWNPCISLTDFIFLSPTGADVADPITLLSPKLQQFIRDAKEAKAPLVAIGFSSMPVSHNAILRLSSLVVEKSTRNARVIAVVGVRPGNEITDIAVETEAQRLKDSNRLIEIGGAPFGILFPFCDFLVVHGGLGTTGEALRAGKPCLITGVLLFDQRFWGRRIYELGCGPKPVHIKSLRSEIVKIVDKGLTPGNSWAEAAKKMAKTLKQSGHGDGIAMSVQAIAEACEKTANGFKQLPSWQSARKFLTTDSAPSIDHDEETTGEGGESSDPSDRRTTSMHIADESSDPTDSHLFATDPTTSQLVARHMPDESSDPIKSQAVTINAADEPTGPSVVTEQS